MKSFTESIVKEAALAWLKALGYVVLHGPDIAPDEPVAERSEYGQLMLEDCLQDTPLPKLISSELRVRSAARFVEFAA